MPYHGFLDDRTRRLSPRFPTVFDHQDEVFAGAFSILQEAIAHALSPLRRSPSRTVAG